MPGVSQQSALRTATWDAPANIAFVKYWGSPDPDAGIPLNTSLSMTLSGARARCTIRPRSRPGVGVLLSRAGGQIADAPAPLGRPVAAHVERILRLAGYGGGADVAIEVGFPVAAGLAASAAIFAAVTRSAVDALGLEPEPASLAELARAGGSGSAARSLIGGYVAWGPAGDGGTWLDAVAPPAHWALSDVIALVDEGPKTVSSRDGHRRALTSPYFDRRLERLEERLERVRRGILERDLGTLGPALEEEAVDLHLIALSSSPPVRYWRPATIGVLEAVEALRAEGVSAWATLDAGPNVHVICEPAHEVVVATRLAGVPGVKHVLRDGVGDGPAQSRSHLLEEDIP